MGEACECSSRRGNSEVVEEVKGAVKIKDCVACQGFGVELRANGEQKCRFCEGRGWVMDVECCSCGRPAAKVVEKGEDKFAICEREECEKKFEKLSWWEFEKLGSSAESDFEDELGWGV